MNVGVLPDATEMSYRVDMVDTLSCLSRLFTVSCIRVIVFIPGRVIGLLWSPNQFVFG